MKKYVTIFSIGFLSLSVNVFALNKKEVNEKVISLFKKAFPSAEKVIWQEFSDKYMVRFEQSNIQMSIDYDKEGNYLQSKRYYQEDNLPVNILFRIRKKYAEYKVFGVTEISTENNTEYYIKLEDSANWLTVKTDVSGIMEVVEKYKKSL